MIARERLVENHCSRFSHMGYVEVITGRSCFPMIYLVPISCRLASQLALAAHNPGHCWA